MKRSEKLFILVVVTFLLGACGSSSSSSGGGSGADDPALKAEQDKCANTPVTTSEDYRYVYSESTNGTSCTTKCQIFYSASSYCAGLQNDTLNNNCASDKRQETYQEMCRQSN